MLLEMKNVVKQFGGLTAVSNMSFSVEKGEIFGVIGPNGAGKTTIFNLITGVYQVTEGDILFDGQSIEGKKPYQIINMGISRTFQNIRLFSGMTVLENILVGHHDRLKSGLLASFLHTSSQKKEEKEARQQALELLRFVGLEAMRTVWPLNFLTANRENWKSPEPWPPSQNSSFWMNRQPA